MSTNYEVTQTLDVMGQNCPMPVIKTKGAMDDLDSGEVLEVLATDPGSNPDIKGWANSVEGVSLLDQVEVEEGGETVYRHYLRKEGA
ncbi:MAG: sulfurtransferase TusA family protein [Halobacteriales archaeon]|nr:sulfurtransferase TusA family protein [Halobacteriales archaeon]